MSVGREEATGQGEQDRQRYKQKIRDQIKKAIPQALDQVPIVSGDGSDSVVIPLPEGGLDLPRFRPAQPKEPGDGVGQGPGQPGDIVGAAPIDGDGSGGAGKAGNARAEHGIDLTLEEIRAIMLDDLHLPPLPLKRPPTQTEPTIRWNTRSRRGSLNNVDAKATLKAALARSQAQQKDLAFTPDDLRYQSWTERDQPKTAAVVYLLRDISGSMTPDKAYLARAVATYIVLWLRTVYDVCPLEFWVHDTVAQPVDELAFFHADDGGGTAVAPAYATLQEDMDTRYPLAAWNRLFLHFSDGDVFDPVASRERARAWLPSLTLLGLVLTKPSPYAYSGSLRQTFAGLPSPYRVVTVQQPGHVVDAVRELLRGEGGIG